MKDQRPVSARSFAFALLAFSACATEEIGPDPDHVVIAGRQAGSNSAFLLVEFAPTSATLTEDEAQLQHANPETRPAYAVSFDGLFIASDYGGPVHFSTVLEGAGALFGYLDAGLHHFTVQASGHAPVFDGDGQLLDGGTTRMFLFGPRSAVQARFVSVPASLPQGAARVTVVNLERGGREIEVVSCTGATTCTPISGVLAPGDVFETDVADAFAGCSFAPSATGPCATALNDEGVGLRYRLVPSASLPNPPMQPINRASAYTSNPNGPFSVFMAAPVYMTDDGLLLRDIRG